MLEKQGLVSDAFDALKNLMKNLLRPMKVVARDLGRNSMKTLGKALSDSRPGVRHAANQVAEETAAELLPIIQKGGKAGKDAMDKLEAGIHSKNPKVRKGMQAVYRIVKDKLDDIPPAATNAGDKAGRNLTKAMQRAINETRVTVPITAGRYTGKIIPRAGGGPVSAGIPYRVNERTPRSEWFVPSTSGQVLTHADAMRAIATGGGGPINVGPITISGVGNDVSVGQAQRFGRAVLGEVAKGLREQRARTV